MLNDEDNEDTKPSRASFYSDFFADALWSVLFDLQLQSDANTAIAVVDTGVMFLFYKLFFISSIALGTSWNL
jgi:hypothetical protein